MSSLRHGDQQSFKDGAKTLIRHGTHGLSNTISKVTSSASRGLASVDTDFLRQREEQNDYKDRPEDYKVGFKQGTSHFVKCVSSGLSGAVSKPAQGYSTGGFKGLAQVLCDLWPPTCRCALCHALPRTGSSTQTCALTSWTPSFFLTDARIGRGWRSAWRG